MKALTIQTAIGVIMSLSAAAALAQQNNFREGTAPIYKLTVVQRTAKAINYAYRSGPTTIDFAGTVVLPHAKGEATVDSRQGRTEIDARLEGLETPQRFGAEYVTYVLWAITPEGRPHNIGELIPDTSNKSKIHVTTDLQAFGLVVTAEPYSAVRQPGDIVVAENQVRPDTVGTIEPLEAKYDLLPRGEYTWTVPSGVAPPNTRMVSMHEYEAEIEIYQAQNAIGIARNADADRYAPDTIERAQRLLTTAKQMHDRKIDYRQVVQNAREAAQTAEDARVIAQRRYQEDQLLAAKQQISIAQAELSNAQQARQQALAEARRVQAEANAGQAEAEARTQAALAARTEAEAEAAAARRSAQEAQAALVIRREVREQESELPLQRERRLRLLGDLRGALPVLDSSRGIVVTVPDDSFRRAELRDQAASQIARIAAVICANRALRVSVEGYSDSAERDAVAGDRAYAVRRILTTNGLPANTVVAAGLGPSRPLVSNTTPLGRKENMRVEIVISGDVIGRLPLWDRTYPLTGSLQPAP